MAFGFQINTSEGMDDVIDINTPLLYGFYTFFVDSTFVPVPNPQPFVSIFGPVQNNLLGYIPYPDGWDSPKDNNQSIIEFDIENIGPLPYEGFDSSPNYLSFTYNDSTRIITVGTSYVPTQGWSQRFRIFILGL